MKPGDEQKRRREIERGQAAQRLIDNPLWQESWDVLYTGTIKQWQATAPDQSALREDLWRVLDVARVVRKHVEKIAQTGRAAEIQLERTAQYGD